MENDDFDEECDEIFDEDYNYDGEWKEEKALDNRDRARDVNWSRYG